MTLDQLIERLTDLQQDGYGDSVVRLAFQPSWPLALDVGRITPLNVNDTGEEDEDGYEGTPPPGWDETAAPPEEFIVWIASGGHPYDASPYAPAGAFG